MAQRPCGKSSLIFSCPSLWQNSPAGNARTGNSPSWQCPDFDAIEPRYAVGLGPERDLAGARDGPVGSGEQFFAVKRDREPRTLCPQAELVPLIRRHLGVGAFDLHA